MDKPTELKNEIDYVTRRNTVKSIIYNDFQYDLSEQNYDRKKVKSLANKITNKINSEYGNGFAVFGWSVQYIVEYLLEYNGVQAFGVEPLLREVPKSKSVPEILNDLVKTHKVKNKHWFTA